MGDIEFTQAAVEDIVEAGVESLLRWGSAQKNRYIENLGERLGRIAAFPFSAPARPDLDPGHRCTPSGAHIIYYLIVPAGIRVIRFLPGVRDPGRHLLSDPFEYRLAEQ